MNIAEATRVRGDGFGQVNTLSAWALDLFLTKAQKIQLDKSKLSNVLTCPKKKKIKTQQK